MPIPWSEGQLDDSDGGIEIGLEIESDAHDEQSGEKNSGHKSLCGIM